MAFVAGLLVLGAVLAGCATPGQVDSGFQSCSGGYVEVRGTCEPHMDYQCPDGSFSAAPCAPGTMVVTGLVESNALVPLAGANVTIVSLHMLQVTDASGRFTFPGIAPSIYNVAAEHAGFLVQTQVARPDVTALQFVLDRAAPTQPYNETYAPLHGVFECASESLIISGSCDALIQDEAHVVVFHNQSSFPFQTSLGWKTIVMDLVFDSSNNPGIAGMRETLRAQNATASFGTYQQYGHFFGATSFSTRIEPGGNYTDGVAPVPANVTSFKVDLYPQGKEWHQACTPDLPGHAGQCFLGAGAAVSLQFTLYVSVFYVTPAPAGFTLLGK